MKYVFLVVALGAILPLADWIRRNPGRQTLVWTIFGALPFVITAGPRPLYIAIISWAEWPGYVRGAEFSVLDVLAIAIYLTLPRASHPLPFRFAMGLYAFAIMISVLFAPAYMATLFYVWQLARMFLIYAVVTRACTDERLTRALLNGLAIGVCVQCYYVLWQRFVQGAVQATGTFGHQNTLGMALYVAVFPAFALLLAGKRGWQLYTVIGASLLIAMSTASRATIGLLGLGLCLVFLISATRKWTSVKMRYAIMGTVAAMVVVPLTLASLERRFQDTSMIDHPDERPAFEEAARMMLNDYPMGVGANNYVVVANAGGYLDRVEIFVFQSRQTSVHNAYWLALAETGYFGFLALLVWMIHPLVVAFRCGWRNRGDPRGDMLLGLGVAFLMLYIHAMYEWVFFTFLIQYVFMIGWGMIAGTAIQLGYWRPVASRRVALDVNHLAGQGLK